MTHIYSIETLCKLMLELNILEPLSLLLSNEKSETVLTMALHTLTALVDTGITTPTNHAHFILYA